jgi:hypothetical protein
VVWREYTQEPFLIHVSKEYLSKLPLRKIRSDTLSLILDKIYAHPFTSDTFIFEDGKIKVQTVAFRLEEKK